MSTPTPQELQLPVDDPKHKLVRGKPPTKVTWNEYVEVYQKLSALCKELHEKKLQSDASSKKMKEERDDFDQKYAAAQIELEHLRKAKTMEIKVSGKQNLVDFYDCYDLIVHTGSPESIYNKDMKGWKIFMKPSKVEILQSIIRNRESPLYIVAVIGGFDKGKSLLINRLVEGNVDGIQVPSSQRIHTYGLSMVYVPFEKKTYLFVDTPGAGAPITVVDEAHVLDKIAEEAYVKNVVYELCNVVIYVVNEITSREQLELNHITKKLKNNKPDFNNIIVVHNFKNADSKEIYDDLNRMYLFDCYGKIGVKKTERVNLENKPSQYLEVVEVMHQIHISLAREGSEFASSHNPYVFELIRRYISSSTKLLKQASQQYTDFLDFLFGAISKPFVEFIEGYPKVTNLEVKPLTTVSSETNAAETYLRMDDQFINAYMKDKLVDNKLQRRKDAGMEVLNFSVVNPTDTKEPTDFSFEVYESVDKSKYIIDVFACAYKFVEERVDHQNDKIFLLFKSLYSHEGNIITHSKRKDQEEISFTVPRAYSLENYEISPIEELGGVFRAVFHKRGLKRT